MIKKILLKTAFLTAIVVAIGLLALGIVQFMPRVFSYIGTASASLFRTFKPAEELTITSSKSTIQSKDSVTLTWNNSDESIENTIEYACIKNVQVYYMGESQSKIPVPCAKTFRMGGETFSANLYIELPQSNTFADVEFIIKQERSSGSTRKGDKIITVTSGTFSNINRGDANEPKKPVLEIATTTKPIKPTPKPTTPSPTYSGPADLAINSITSGYINPISGLFVPSNTIDASQTGAVQFTVTNNGGSPTGIWNIVSTLPTTEKLFKSDNLSPLSPGSSVIFTLRLGSISTNGRYSIVVVAGADESIIEQNESNNGAETTLIVSGGISGNTGSNDPDLVVRVLAIGYINPRTGALQNNFSDTIGVKFEIRNIGGKTARNWRFRAELPTNDSNDEEFISDEERDLDPGDAIEYTLGFDNATDDGFVEIEVDDQDDVYESNERNNTIRVRVTN